MDSVRVVIQVLAVTDKDAVTDNRRLVKIIDLLGHESQVTTSKPLFYIYDDGSIEKKINLPY
jgi:hypothetical protein